MAYKLKVGTYLGQVLDEHKNDLFKLTITLYEPESKTISHCHENDYISILTNGQYLEENNNGTNVVSPGDILYRPGFYEHQNSFDFLGGACFNIDLQPELFKYLEIQDYAHLSMPFTRFKSGSIQSLYKLLVNFQRNYNEDLAFELICDTMFQCFAQHQIKKRQPWIVNVMKIIMNEPECFHSLHNLSERVFVHPVYLSRAFKANSGMTIGEFQIKTKMSNAVTQLMNTHHTISEISFCNGFYDDAHFIRTFKSVYKVSPHQFRLSMKKLI